MLIARIMHCLPVVLFFFVGALSAQTTSAFQIGEIKPYGFASKPANNHDTVPRMVAEKFVRFPGASYVQLEFGSVRTGAGGWIEIQSVDDRATELLTVATIARNRNQSAFFNGGAVRVRLFAGPQSRGNLLSIQSVAVGFPNARRLPETICGNNDNRAPSTDKRVARGIINRTLCKCSYFLISSKNCFATAGHCFTNFAPVTSLTVQFNVPPSSSTGSCRHPGPQDQYSWAGAAQADWSNPPGVGNDWGVFLTNANSTTGKHAGQAQGSYFRFIDAPTSRKTIRVTGYGVDSTPDLTRNRVQQTSTGSYGGRMGDSVMHRVDTMSGNSGGPIIDDASNRVLGIHAYGGCTPTGGNNSGTWIYNDNFIDACRRICGSGSDYGDYEDDPTKTGTGCKGSGTEKCNTTCISLNGDSRASSLTGAIGTTNRVFVLEAVARSNVTVCGFELITKWTASGNVRAFVYLADTAGRPAAAPVRRSNLTVSRTAAWTRATFTPLSLAAGTKFFVGFQNPAPSLTLSTVRIGGLGVHYVRGSSGWTGPFRTANWAYRVLCGRPGPNATPRLTHSAIPAIGRSFTVGLSRARPISAALLILGVSNKRWGLFPLPLNLGVLGAPGCWLRVSGDVLFSSPTNSAGGASLQISIPNSTGLIGLRFYNQWAVADPVNALGLAWSNGGEGKIGR